jgi:hypothetical protein
MLASLCSGGLEPAFRVLFSAVFHEFRSGISIGVEICGKELNQNCSFFVVNLITKSSCVGLSLPFTDLKNPSITRFGRTPFIANSARLLVGSTNAGTPQTDRHTPGTGGIDYFPRASVAVRIGSLIASYPNVHLLRAYVLGPG